MKRCLRFITSAVLILALSSESKIINTMHLQLKREKSEEARWNICGLERRSGPVSPSKYDLKLYVDNSPRPYILLIGSSNTSIMNIYTSGGESWEESMLLDSPPSSSRPKPFLAIGDLDVGEIFWFKAQDDEFILCRIAGILPEGLFENATKESVKVTIDWVECSKEINIDQILPIGWRLPKEEDFYVGGKMTDYRKYLLSVVKSPLYMVGADFNGDCVVDYACVLVSNDNAMYAVKVFMGLDNEGYRCIDYATIKGKLPDGYYLSYCAPGLLESHWDSPMKLLNHAFYINHFESASSLIYFDTNTYDFKSWRQSD